MPRPLPELPFGDRAFDLVLSANFLMVYAPLADGGMHDAGEFGLDFHRRAFRELACWWPGGGERCAGVASNCMASQS